MTAVRPLTLDQLPRSSGRGLVAARQGAARLAARNGWREISVPSLGRVRLACLAVVAPDDPEPSDAVWILVKDGREGRLILANGMALLIAAAVIGLPSPRMVRPLGPAERGMIAAIIAAVGASVRGDVALSLRTRGSFGADLVRVVVAFRAGRLEGRLSLDVPCDWIPAPPPPTLVEAALASRLPFVLSVVVGRTALSAADWSAALVGDAVLFDGLPAVSPSGPCALEVMSGSFAATAQREADGVVRIAGPFDQRSRAAHRAGDWNGGTNMSVTDEDPDVAKSAVVLASAPVEVVAEIGRVELRADELMGLRPGAVLPVGALKSTGVELRVGDRLWARGELVDVDGQLGVRITELVAQA